jgi:hypothetical protein
VEQNSAVCGEYEPAFLLDSIIVTTVHHHHNRRPLAMFLSPSLKRIRNLARAVTGEGKGKVGHHRQLVCEVSALDIVEGNESGFSIN